jgi:hypothetical protein
MPIEATPFEHDVVAEAAKDTAPDTVAPFAGDVTVTPVANAAGAKIPNRHTISDRYFSMQQFSKSLLASDVLGLRAKLPRYAQAGAPRPEQKRRDSVGLSAVDFKSLRPAQMPNEPGNCLKPIRSFQRVPEILYSHQAKTVSGRSRRFYN